MPGIDAPFLPYGSWPSPLGLDAVTGATLRLSPPVIDGDGTYWKESGADGRGVIMVSHGGDLSPVTTTFEDGTEVDVATRVHEYGGRDFAVDDGVVLFSARRDDRLYVTVRDDDGWTVPAPVTPNDGVRYADIVMWEGIAYAVAERHDGPSASEVVNYLARIDIAGREVQTLREGADFYGGPRPNASGLALAWYEWNHPNMPWDAAELWVAAMDETGLSEARRIEGGEGISAFSPVWVTEDELAFVADPQGWWNVMRCEDPLGECRVRHVHPAPVEFAAPPWTFDTSLSVLDDEHLVVRWTQEGIWSFGSMRIANGELEEWLTGWEPTSDITTGGGRITYVGGREDEPTALVELALGEATVRILRRSAEPVLGPEWVSHAQPITWDSEGGESHGFFYPPTSPEARGPESELPPLIVLVHGGPTSATNGVFTPYIQYATTRGLAVLDVNYRGSTGYGRVYREALQGQWGVADLEDVASGVAYLADEGLIDARRVAIRGGSAGGYTVLRALTATSAFTAGVSRYGIADLAVLAGDTHKFESRYTEGLVAPFPSEIYRERSPLFHLENLSAPVLLLQGEDDKVVPPEQATLMADAIRERGGDVELVMYPGEGHGFRRAENAKDALEREFGFYARVFGYA